MNRRTPLGFTLVEALIVLAVSGMILLTAVIFMSGRESSTRFSQSMRDIHSKMQDWINDVTTGYPGSAVGQDNYCVLNGSRPLINSKAISGSSPTSSPDCIFLGKVVHFRSDDTKVYAYSVFGRRALPSGNLVTSLSEANPVVAVGTTSAAYNSGTADLTEAYQLKGGTRIKSIIEPTGTDRSRLGAFYLSFNPTSVKTNGSADLVAYQLPFSSNAAPGQSVYNCISMVSCASPTTLSNWQICFESSDQSQTAAITVSASGGSGVATSLGFKQC